MKRDLSPFPNRKGYPLVKVNAVREVQSTGGEGLCPSLRFRVASALMLSTSRNECQQARMDGRQETAIVSTIKAANMGTKKPSGRLSWIG